MDMFIQSLTPILVRKFTQVGITRYVGSDVGGIEMRRDGKIHGFLDVKLRRRFAKVILLEEIQLETRIRPEYE